MEVNLNTLGELILALRNTVGALCTEESHRLSMSGQSLTTQQVALLGQIQTTLQTLSANNALLLRVNESSANDELQDDPDSLLRLPWRVIIGKRELLPMFGGPSEEQTVLFFSETGFLQWLEDVNPFTKLDSDEPDFSRPLTVGIHGLRAGYGGPSLQVRPLASSWGDFRKPARFPSEDEVLQVVHPVSSQRTLQISPTGWALTWGDLHSASAQRIIQIGCLVFGACLVHEFRLSDDAWKVTIRGARTIVLPFWDSNLELPWQKLYENLSTAIRWVYQERSETRLKLLADRLSLDMNQGQCWLSCLYQHLDTALRHAEDSYDFVIRDRKDAYYKEMRDLMKDMKAQADLYAAKVRDLVGSLVRDILGLMVFLSLSFIGKFDQEKMGELLASPEVGVFLKALAIYLALSFSMQLAAHLRDDKLTRKEVESWLDILQNYTSSDERRKRFLGPLDKRRETLYCALRISAFIYGCLFFAVWNLPCIIPAVVGTQF